MFVGRNVTEQMRQFDRRTASTKVDFVPTERDRSKRGKRRRRDRKVADKQTP